jgi:CDP-diacylglycerol---serine O-phosphatidyltransferase
MNRKKKMFAVLPTALTLGNAVCGFVAITFLSDLTGFAHSISLITASCLIYLAMVFDALDGTTARWTKQTTEFGAQLDSLCDAISFGAAPALLMLRFSEPYGYHSRLMWTAAALYVVCAVLRLARYNVEPSDDTKPRHFTGLPSPAAAAVVASFPMMVYGPELVSSGQPIEVTDGHAQLDLFAKRILPLVTFAVACLMVSRFRFMRHFLVRNRRNAKSFIQLLLIVALIVAIPRIAAPLLACWYAFATPLYWFWERYVLRRLNRPAVGMLALTETGTKTIDGPIEPTQTN